MADLEPRTCAACRGSGKVIVMQEKDEGNGQVGTTQPCPKCFGAGAVMAVDHQCAFCAGMGKVDQEECPVCKGTGWPFRHQPRPQQQAPPQAIGVPEHLLRQMRAQGKGGRI
ncbi:MAG: hypothetical protein GF355_09640 [Candidatus Eisenbacteria bacterium]|nr:hypothetical protein [Candidatus Eisenbacteria bacterium]